MSGTEQTDANKWTYGVRYIPDILDRAKWRNTLTYRLLPRLTVGVEYNPLAKDVKPLANWLAISETEKRPAVIFFHGLGLSHMDLEQSSPEGKPNGDWKLEEGMVVPMHLLVPGGERERYWLEEVAVVGKRASRPLFSWGFGPI